MSYNLETLITVLLNTFSNFLKFKLKPYAFWYKFVLNLLEPNLMLEMADEKEQNIVYNNVSNC